jgi:hypothetical protein
MTPSQLAIVGAKARELYDAQAKERQKEHGGTAPGKAAITCGNVSTSDLGRSRDKAGEAVGVSGKLVDSATKILKSGTKKLVKDVEAGKVSVTAAAKKLKADELPQEPKKNGKPTYNPQQFKAVYEYLGHALPKIGALNRTHPTKFYHQAETSIKAAMQSITDWAKAVRP